jgi:hypothetical protein
VDADGDVFVLYYGFYGTGVFEYKGGLAGCNATHVLRDTYAWDMILDSNKDLIISRTVFYSGGSFGEVDVFDPPYAYGGTIGSGFSSPTGISLNKKNKLLFVADSYSGEVTVVNYQTGQNIKELGAAYGISDPRAVVDGPNAVY